jgi:hypothetical protein
MDDLFGADGTLPPGYGSGTASGAAGFGSVALGSPFDRGNTPNLPSGGYINGSVGPIGGPQSPTVMVHSNSPAWGPPPGPVPQGWRGTAGQSYGAAQQGYPPSGGNYGAQQHPPYQDYKGSGGYRYRVHYPSGVVEVVAAPAVAGASGVGSRLTAQSNPAAYQAIMVDIRNTAQGRQMDPAIIARLITTGATLGPRPAPLGPMSAQLPAPSQVFPASVMTEPESKIVPTWMWWVGGALAVAAVGGTAWWFVKRKK